MKRGWKRASAARLADDIRESLRSMGQGGKRLPAARAPSRFLFVDGTNTLYRAFFAIPSLRAPDGTPTNAAYGFVNTLRKVMREERSERVVVVFDARGETFRHRLYPDYKAGREAQPEDLSAQVPLVRELVEAHGIPILEVEGFEADDVIATLVAQVPSGARVAIVSTDKDLMQLVSDRVTLLDGMKDTRYGPAEVEARFGVAPERILDLRSLVGDSSDNIPGVKGIGAKGAAQLLAEWGDLENLLAHADEVSAKRSRTALRERADDARLSKRLSTLRDDVPLPLDPRSLPAPEEDVGRLRALFERLGMTRLLEGLEGGSGRPAEAAPELRVEQLGEAADLEGLLEELARLPCVPLLVVREEGPASGEAVGLALALSAERAAYLPLGAALPAARVVEWLAPLLVSPARVAWLAPASKDAMFLFAENGAELPVPEFDVELAGGLLDSSGSSSTLVALAARHGAGRPRPWQDLAGRGARARRASEIAQEELASWAGASVCAAAALRAPLEKRLAEDGLETLFREVELPLTRVLARMERAGVRVDERVLAELSLEYERELARIEDTIHRLAGESFLVSSPKQLQRILFEKLKLPVVKKTKTGYSTDEDVLEQLSAHHELPAAVLAHRRLAKLRNTYVDALPPLVNPATGRIHPTFNQLGAATGRLSATRPNVQNIPIRTPEGVRIREAFVPAEGCLLLSADYSQVELRIMAHYSRDESLMEAFRTGEDIHRRTAAEVAGIPVEEVTDEQRARAKAVNFGILYGSSAFGLANQLGIASAEAQQTIDAYFERYRGVRRFLDQTIEEARECGFVRTLLGRRRQLPDIGSRNRTLRNAAERMAVNSVIQGTAADLIKKAMVAVDAAIGDLPSARLILQVHDELVFEVAHREASSLGERVRSLMEGVLPLRVPLVVDIGAGRNWREAH